MTSFECHKNGRERSVQKEVKKKVKDFFMKIVQFTTVQYVYVHSVSYVYAVLPFYDVKGLYSGGRE